MFNSPLFRWYIRAVLVLENSDPHSIFDRTEEIERTTTRRYDWKGAVEQLQLDVTHWLVTNGISETDILDIEIHLSPLTTAPTDSPTAYPRPDFKPTSSTVDNAQPSS